MTQSGVVWFVENRMKRNINVEFRLLRYSYSFFLTMPESIAIIGAGITGLAAAYVLSAKYNVTIVARDLPGDMGTNWASPWYDLYSTRASCDS